MEVSEKRNIVETKENAYIKWSIEDGILYIGIKEIEIFDLDIAKACVNDRLEFTGENFYPCLVDVVKVGSMTKEARDYFAKEGSEYLTACAIVVSSAFLKMLTNFYIMVNKPETPTRMFTDRESALEWLNQCKT